MTLTSGQIEYVVAHLYHVAAAFGRRLMHGQEENDEISQLLRSDIQDMLNQPARSEVLRDWLFLKKWNRKKTCYQIVHTEFSNNLAKQIAKDVPLRNIDRQIETNSMLARCAVNQQRRYELRREIHQQRLERERIAAELSNEPDIPLITREMNQIIVDTVERGLKDVLRIVDYIGAPLLSGSVVMATMTDNSRHIGIYNDSNGVTLPMFLPKNCTEPIPVDSSMRLTLLSEKSEHLDLPLFQNLDMLADPQTRALILKDLEHVKAIAHEQMALAEESEMEKEEVEESAPVREEQEQEQDKPQTKRRRAANRKPRRLAGTNPFSLEKRVKQGRFV